MRVLLCGRKILIVVGIAFAQGRDGEIGECPGSMNTIVLSLCRAGIVETEIREGRRLMTGDTIADFPTFQTF